MVFAIFAVLAFAMIGALAAPTSGPILTKPLSNSGPFTITAAFVDTHRRIDLKVSDDGIVNNVITGALGTNRDFPIDQYQLTNGRLETLAAQIAGFVDSSANNVTPGQVLTFQFGDPNKGAAIFTGVVSSIALAGVLSGLHLLLQFGADVATFSSSNPSKAVILFWLSMVTPSPSLSVSEVAGKDGLQVAVFNASPNFPNDYIFDTCVRIHLELVGLL
ncbi:hypothetical protein K474DRAFT_1708211 [Panus rudis PR-1116 ss-1]|nr:hypothetical protein K474DRAFT_1708211 [Panus rudis PR-1116 ss-1]